MINDLLERIRSFNEHQALRKLDAIPKNIPAEDYNLNHFLMLEELNEYLKACKENDLVEISDSVGDMFFVLWGIICKHGLQDVFFQHILLPICDSNETKFCNTRDEALLSTINLGYKNNAPYNFHEWKGKYVVFNSDTGKLSKGFNYKEPVFTFTMPEDGK